MKSKLGGTIQAVVATLLHTKECCAYESSVTGRRHTARDEVSIIGQLDGQFAPRRPLDGQKPKIDRSYVVRNLWQGLRAPLRSEAIQGQNVRSVLRADVKFYQC